MLEPQLQGAARALDLRLLDGADQAVIVTDMERRITYWNAAAERLYGWTAAEVIGRDILGVTPMEAEPARQVIEPVEQGAVWAGQFRVRRKSGEAFSAFVTISPVRDETGAPIGVLGLSFDLSSTTLAERSLHYDALFETMSEGFAVCEAIFAEDGALADYRVIEMNPALLRMLGIGPEAVGGKLSATAGDFAAWLALCDGVLKTGAPASFEFKNARTGLTHEIHVSRISDSRMAQFFFDITARKAAQARQAELFDELNHRVKNNLTLVTGLLHMQARASANAEVREQLGKAVDRVHAIAQVHGALHQSTRREVIDLGAYLRDLCSSLGQSLDLGERLDLTVEVESVDIATDVAIPLGMLVNELVTNAVKHAYPPPQAGTISVSLRRDGETLELTVGDAGRGLPDDADGRAGALGMRLVGSLVAQVGGKLVVRRHPGATFEVRLPLPKPAPAAVEPPLL